MHKKGDEKLREETPPLWGGWVGIEQAAAEHKKGDGKPSPFLCSLWGSCADAHNCALSIPPGPLLKGESWVRAARTKQKWR